MGAFDVPLNRRSILRGGASLSAAAFLAACGGGSRSGSSSTKSTVSTGAFDNAGIDWKQFSGTEITFAAMSHPWVNALQPHLQEFTNLTGIKVTPQILGEDQYVSKIAVTLAGGSDTPDVYLVYQLGQSISSGWLEPLDGFLSDSKLTNPSWYGYEQDVFPAARSYVQSGGKTYVAPITTEIQVIYTRKDLVTGSLATLDDLVKAAVAANQGNTAGIGMRASANPSESPWPYAGFAFTHGGYMIDPSGKPALDSAANVAALTMYGDLLRKYGPKGVTGWGWLENNESMSQGRQAMWSDTSTFLGGLRDSSKSQIADKVAAYPFPSFNGKSVPNFWFWTAGINAKSKQKKAAWLFLQWATSKPMAAIAGAAGTSPSRASAWQDPAVEKNLGADNVGRILDSLKAADSQPMALAWKHPQWPQISDAIARAVNSVVAGSSEPAAALQAAQRTAVAAVK
ncbi:MAG: substrate-binding protein [Dactylosporangium sp.]|jgi:multiple sugar transport system substrate-binding protein|nr:substrate-binding protein [Dactylosporangium sp.]